MGIAFSLRIVCAVSLNAWDEACKQTRFFPSVCKMYSTRRLAGMRRAIASSKETAENDPVTEASGSALRG
jgi:hypothetical protein